MFEHLMKEKKPIISDAIVEDCIKERKVLFAYFSICAFQMQLTCFCFQVLPFPKHPLFNYSMKNFVICFSITDKKDTVWAYGLFIVNNFY